MNNGYSLSQNHLIGGDSLMNYSVYQGSHRTTNQSETGFLLNYANFDQQEDTYLNLYTGFNQEASSFLRNQTSGALGSTESNTYHTGFSYEDKIAKDFYFGSNFNIGYTETSTSPNSLLSSIDPLITSQYVLGFVEKNILNSKDLLSLNFSQPLSIEQGKALVKIPYYDNLSSNGYTEKEIDMSVSERINHLNLDYIYSFQKDNQIHLGITSGINDYSNFSNHSLLANYKLLF